ncbi:hypothetical protein DAPPUDRAFT_320063 [Daphnia pulex]|uniref:Uncharacterized protein n=1 Tax=Daphnia pulex TaxID=6669 RepID=E9GNQ6_DAPPU|nr:hypothetical protein DAPPUDRAFT_320063 [Daphnia pulex]|eukprot:EFX78915.1 hypothetical protein DAPPUDRAFT_320063 [Daphnia pulex]
MKNALVGSFTGRSTRGHDIFYQRYLSFNLREGLEHNIPDGVEHALLTFKKQERSLIKLTPALPVTSNSLFHTQRQPRMQD